MLRSMEPAVENGPTTPAIEKHRSWKTLEKTVLAIIDDTFDTALCIAKMKTQSHSSIPGVDLWQFIDPADKDSPVLTVHAEATSCCFAFNNSRRDAAAYANYTAKSGKSAPTHRFRGAAISISPGTLHLAHDGKPGLVIGRSAAGYSGVNPDVGSSSSSSRPLGDVLAILDAVVKRLDEAIGMEEAMLRKAKALSWCGSRPGFAAEIEQVLEALREMRSETDIEAVMRRRLQKRRRCVVQEIGPADAVDRGRADKTAEELAKRLKRMEIGSSSSL